MCSLNEPGLQDNRPLHIAPRDISHEDLERLPYTEAVVYEALRMYPPAVLTPRISSAATKVCTS